MLLFVNDWTVLFPNLLTLWTICFVLVTTLFGLALRFYIIISRSAQLKKFIVAATARQDFAALKAWCRLNVDEVEEVYELWPSLFA